MSNAMAGMDNSAANARTLHAKNAPHAAAVAVAKTLELAAVTTRKCLCIHIESSWPRFPDQGAWCGCCATTQASDSSGSLVHCWLLHEEL